jgi:tetratricopeptide (TPR) repeat protein
LNLGIALAKLNRLDEASAQFQETLRLDPNNRKASEYLEALRKADRRKR